MLSTLMGSGYSRPLLRSELTADVLNFDTQVVFVATEVAPWSKTGGLADVMGALPTQLAAK